MKPFSEVIIAALCLSLLAAGAQAQTSPPALQIVNDVPQAGTIVPAEKPASAAPQPTPQAAQPEAPAIIRFPVTEKVQTDTLNPSAPPTGPVPAPDVAASITQPPPAPRPASISRPAPKPSIVRPAKLPSLQAPPAKIPPVPQPRPAVVDAPSSYAAIPQPEAPQPAPETILKGKPAGPKMPVVRPQAIQTEPLDDPLARQLVKPDKQALVQAIEAVAGRTKPPASLAPAAPVQQKVKTPAETLNPLPPAVHVPGPGEKDFLTLPAHAGDTNLEPGAIALLQTRIVAALKKNPSWQLQIDAYASAVNDEPLNGRRIALTRALAVRAWLMDHGVEARRLNLRALGPETGHNPPDQTELSLFVPDDKTR